MMREESGMTRNGRCALPIGLVLCLLVSAVLADGRKCERGIDPVVSLFINSTTTLPDDPVEIEMMRKLRREYGLRRFMLDPPGLRRAMGQWDRASHVRLGEAFKRAKEALAGEDIEICWWDRPALGWSRRFPGQRIMDCDGNVSSALCPLDNEANTPFLEYFKTAGEIGRPDLYILEDDFNLSGHAGLANPHGGCFCPLHLKKFAEKVGRTYTAKEIGGFYDRPTSENEPLRRAFAEVSRDSLVHFAKRIRATLDSFDPEKRIFLFQSAQVDYDGDTTYGNAKALAGKTRPMVRVYGAQYFSENVPRDLPMVTAHMFYSMQHLPDEVEKVYEADAFPHTRFYNSTRFYLSEICAGMMAGAEDLMMFCVRTARDPLVDYAYLDMFKANRARFDAIREFRRRSALVGVRAVGSSEEKSLYRTRETPMLDECARVLAKFGFPMTTLPSDASVLFGETAARLSEAELRDVFKGAVIVDSTAALALQARGLGSWLGCKVESAEETLEFSRSRTLPVAGARVTGVNSYDYHVLEPVVPVPGWDMKMNYVRIAPGERSETMIRYENPANEVVAPSFVSTKNPLGGTTGVMSFAVRGNFREWLYCPCLQDVFRNFFDRATGGKLDVVATRTPGTWLSAAVSDDGQELLVMVNNLAGEPRNDIRLEFAERWRGGNVMRLDSDGMWTDVGCATDAFVPLGGLTYAAMKPEFFRVVKQLGR